MVPLMIERTTGRAGGFREFFAWGSRRALPDASPSREVRNPLRVPKLIFARYPSGSGMNSCSSPGTSGNGPSGAPRRSRQSRFACSMRASELETKFHQM